MWKKTENYTVTDYCLMRHPLQYKAIWLIDLRLNKCVQAKFLVSFKRNIKQQHYFVLEKVVLAISGGQAADLSSAYLCLLQLSFGKCMVICESSNKQTKREIWWRWTHTKKM